MRVQGVVVGLIGCRGEERAVVYPAGKASAGGGWRRGGWTVAGQQVGGLAALGLPGGGKRGGESGYRVADIGRRRAPGAKERKESVQARSGVSGAGCGGGVCQLFDLPTCRFVGLSVCWEVGDLASWHYTAASAGVRQGEMASAADTGWDV